MKDGDVPAGTATRLSTQAAMIATGRGVAMLSTLLTAAVLSRLLAPELYGTYRQLWLVYQILTPVIVLGIPMSVAFFIPQMKRVEQKAFMVQNGSVLLAGGVVAGIVLALVATPLARAFGNPELPALLPVFGLFVLCSMPFLLVDVFLVSRGQPKAAAAVSILSAVFQAIAVLVPASMGAPLSQVVTSLSIFAAFRIVILAVVFLLRFRDTPFELDLEAFRSQLRYSLPLGIAAISGTLALYIDKLIVSATFEPSVFAVYVNGSMEIPLVVIVTSSVTAVLIPAIVRDWDRGDGESVRKVWHASAAALSKVFFPLTIILFLLAEDLMVILFSDTYRASKDPFRVLLFLLPLRIAMHGGLVRALGLSRAVMTSALLTLVLGASLAFLLARWIGLLGPCMALVIATYVSAAYLIAVACRRTGWRLAEYFPWPTLFRIMSIAIVAGVPVVVMNVLLSGHVHWLFRVALAIVLYGGTYFGLGAATKWVSWTDVMRPIRDGQKGVQRLLKIGAKPS